MDLACNGVRAPRLPAAAWRKSTHSNPSGNCVEVAELPGGRVALRNSRHPDGAALIFTREGWEAFLLGIRNGDLAQHR